MLTAKGIGGGSAKVTNGILQEMYAAEGKIPAGTFVDVRESLGDPESSESLAVLGSSELSINSYNAEHVKVNGVDLLVRVAYSCKKTNNNAILTATITCKKMDGYAYVNIPDLSVSSDSFAMWSTSADIASKPVPIVLNDNKILFLDGCCYTMYSSGQKGVHLTYFIVDVSEEGTLSIPNGSTLRLLYMYGTTNYETIDIFPIKAHKLDASTIGCFILRREANYSSSGSLSEVNYKLHAYKLSLNSEDNLSKSKDTLLAHDQIVSSFDDYNLTPALLNSVDVQDTLVIGYFLYNRKTYGNIKEFCTVAIDKSSWNKFTVKNGTKGLTYNVPFRMYVVDNHLIVFSQSDNQSLAADVFSVQKNSDALSVALLHSLPDLQNDNLIGEAYVSYPAILNNNQFMISSYQTGSPYVHSLKLLEFKAQTLSEVTSWFNAPDTIPNHNSRFVIFQAINDVILLLSQDYVYLCKFGTLHPFAHLPNDSFNGLTKTACTETEKGKVWLLDTQEGV